MLRQLSSIEHNHRLRQLRKKRYNNTGSWVAGTDQFYQWVQTNKHSCLWCYGIRMTRPQFPLAETRANHALAGCGKTVLAYVSVQDCSSACIGLMIVITEPP